MIEDCPICGGTGKKVLVTPHALTKRPRTTVDWCMCMRSRLVSDEANFKLLSSLGDDYIPMDKVDKNLVFVPNELPKSPNLLVQGDFDTFRYHVKSIMMKYRFSEPFPFMYCCYAIDLLKDFYVQQSDKTSPGLMETNKFDLLAFTLGTKEKNDQLNTVISQIVYLRQNCRKPTWIFLPTPTLEQCPREHSPELAEVLQRFDKVTLKGSTGKVVGPTKNKNDAASFGGLG